MSQSLEDLVRSVQHEQAERAVDPRRVLAALPQLRVRAVRRRRLILAGVAAVVAAVVAVPVFALRQGPAPQPPSATPGPSVSPALSQLVPLKYSPGWLPAGYTEYQRVTRPPALLFRTWGTAPSKSPLISQPAGRLSMSVAAAEDSDATKGTGGETVDINGVSGVYRTEEAPRVSWRIGGTSIVLSTPETSLSRDTLLRIARSVRPDPAAMEPPLAVRVPAGQSVVGQFVAGFSAGGWLATTTLGELTPSGRLAVLGASISVGTMTRAPAGGTALRVAGHPARYVRNKHSATGHYLVVDLGGSLNLTVHSEDLDRPAIVALAESAGTPNPGAIAWIGR